MKNNKGFTLTELLATIVLLVLVLGVSLYAAINVINGTKSKSYDVTINNIESIANTYLTENSDRLEFVSNDEIAKKGNNIEYQCVTIKNLIDYGYLKNNITESLVAENQNVSVDDYIYVERDINSKSINKVIYVGNSAEYNGLCRAGLLTKGNITFDVVPVDWSKEKEITIKYKLKSVHDVKDVDNISYNYSYSGSSDLLNDGGTTKKIKVTTNGELFANIKLGTDIIEDDSIKISKIDLIGPIISLGDYPSGNVKQKATININVTDAGSGVNYGSFTKNDLKVTIGGANITNFTLTKSGNAYVLEINDLTHAGAVVITIEKDKILDNLGNGNNSTELKPNITFDNTYTVNYNSNGGNACNPVNKTVVYGTAYGTLCSPSRSGYSFTGWYTAASGGDKIETSTIVKIEDTQTLYAHWQVVSSGGGGGGWGGSMCWGCAGGSYCGGYSAC